MRVEVFEMGADHLYELKFTSEKSCGSVEVTEVKSQSKPQEKYLSIRRTANAAHVLKCIK